MTPAEDLICEIARLWAPPKKLTVSQWADLYRHLSPESAAKPGKWVTHPFQREPMDAISDSRVSRVVIKSATQMLKTSVLENAAGYFAHQDPGPVMVIQPGDQDAKDFSKEKLAPMIRDSPVLKAIFSESKSRHSDSTITQKHFAGGLLVIVGAGSARNLARRSIRVLLADEIDKYKSTQEGNPLALARKRLATFRHRAKEVNTCSPTVEGSEIDKAYASSDKREYYVPCPHCGVYQSMMGRWDHVRWDSLAGLTLLERAQTAAYYCDACDRPWTDLERWSAVENGQWRAHAPFAGIAGFWISELYSPWKHLWEIVLDFLQKKDDSEDLRTFVNTSLAENWKEKGDAPPDELLYERARREKYTRGIVPKGGLFLTCGVDVQKTYLQYEVVAWGRNQESWSIDYQILDGSPSAPAVWEKLRNLLGEQFPHESGSMLPIAKMAVDTGHETNNVYQWVRSTGGQAIAVDGRQGGSVAVAHPSLVDVTVSGRKISNGLKLWPVATSMLKAELYGRLNLKPPTEEELAAGSPYPAGYCHFPAYDAEFFKQLTAEQLITRYVKGYTKLEWQKTRPRNEALDCRVYARAAAYVVGLDRMSSANWEQLELDLKNSDEAAAEVASAQVVRQRGSWFGRGTGNWFGR